MAFSENKPCPEGIQELLKSVQEQCKRLQEENGRLRAMLGIPESAGDGPASLGNVVPADSTKSPGRPSTPEEKIALFRNLFRGREDVYAVRWEGGGGKSGYSP